MTDQEIVDGLKVNMKCGQCLTPAEVDLLLSSECLLLSPDGILMKVRVKKIEPSRIYRLPLNYELPKDEQPPETLPFDLDWSRGYSSFTPKEGTICGHLYEGFIYQGFIYQGYTYSFDYYEYTTGRSAYIPEMYPSYAGERAIKIVFRRWDKVK